MAWRVAKALLKLREQINAKFPERSKLSDGTIGDAAHASRNSDHDPWIITPDGYGIVSAMDITNDPAHGLDSEQLANALLKSQDPRLKYVISNRKIASGTDQGHPAWLWRSYTGKNAHNHHVHISVKSDAAHYDSEAEWKLDIAPPRAITHSTPPQKPNLELGSKGDAVKEVQDAIGIPADGIFGQHTVDAVKTFQSKHGLVVDGRVGSQTWEAIAKGVK